MEAVILVIHLIVAIAIICIVLIQPSESGGFLGNSGSMSNMMMPRRSADVLTRATTILAGCFFVTSLVLAVMAGNRPAESSILDNVSGETPAVAAPAAADAVATESDAEKDAAPEAAPKAPKAPISQ